MDGTVKWFDDKKGFGFIAAEGKDYFAHYKEIQGAGFKTLEADSRVEFEPTKGAKGLIASKIRVLA